MITNKVSPPPPAGFTGDLVTVTDNGDGTYAVRYMVPRDGMHHMNILLNNKPVTGGCASC